MRQRIGAPPFSACLPIWAWFQWENHRKKRPDLRFSAHLPRGEVGVLVEFSAEPAAVLLSDFLLWHYVLNYWYLPESVVDEKRFDATVKSLGADVPSGVAKKNEAFHVEVRKSWDKIFDIHVATRGISYKYSQKRIQATLWTLRKDMVRDAVIFRAR